MWLRYIEIAELRPGGLWESFLALLLLLLTLTILPRKCYDGQKTPRRAVLVLLTLYWPLFVISLGLNSWGDAGNFFLFVARLSLYVAVVRLGLIVVLDMLIPRWRGRVIPRIHLEILHGLVYAAGTFWLLAAAGLDAVSLLTTGTVVGAILGLSLQETLGNLFAGLAVQAQAPFRVGDWLQLDEKGQPGRVVEINWRAARIVTLDQTELVVPNAVIARNTFTNFNAPRRMFRRPIIFNAPWDVPPGQVQELARRAAQAVNHPKAPPATCIVQGFQEGQVRYEIQLWVDDMERWELANSSVLERLWADFHLNKIRLKSVVEMRSVESARPPGDEGTELEMERRAHTLATCPWGGALSPEQRRLLARHLAPRRYLEGDVLTQRGEIGSEIYLLVEGRLACDSQEGQEIREGQAVGDLAQLTGTPWPFTCTVLEESQVYVVEARDLELITQPGANT